MSGFGGFGTTPTTGGLFGAKPPETAPTTTTSGLTFGTPTFGSPGTGLFGTSSANPTFGCLALTTTTNTGFTFGNPSTNIGTPTSFVTPVTTSTSALGSTFNFNPSNITTSANFLTTTTTTSQSLSFGLANQTTAPSLGFGINQTTSQSTGFTFSQQTSSLSFGAPKTTANLSFGTTSTFSVPSTTPAFNFRFTSPVIATTTTTSTSTTTTTTTTTTTGLTFGLTTGSKPNDGKSVVTPGLGGVDKSELNEGLSGVGKAEPKQIQYCILPDKILQTLTDFQNFTKQQKSISVEISHGSSKPLKKVQEDTEVMESLLTMITSGLTRNALAIDKLKTETAQGLHQAEMAQRNHETPPGLDYDSTAPAEYFNDLVTKFETDTMRLRVQIEASEKHLRSLTQSTSISPQELTLAMRRLHETLVVLAARVQTLHTTVQSQKEQYRNLRRIYLKDDSTIFDKDTDFQHNRKQTIFSLHSLTGPTPFSDSTGSGRPLNVDGLAMLTETNAALVNSVTKPGWIAPLPSSTGSGSILPSTNTLQTSQPCETTGFQLSKPPPGNKRNKR